MRIARLLRATRRARGLTALPRRPDVDLPFLADLPETGGALLLDTCVYVDQLRGRLPRTVEAQVLARPVYHSALCLAELCFPFGRLDPADPRTAAALRAIEDLVAAIPEERILAPSADTAARGAILAGVQARVLGHDEARRRRGLIDAMVAAQAVAEGLMLVTRNVGDFDRLSRAEGKLRVGFYRT